MSKLLKLYLFKRIFIILSFSSWHIGKKYIFCKLSDNIMYIQAGAIAHIQLTPTYNF